MMEFSQDKFDKLEKSKGYELSKRYYINIEGNEDLRTLNEKMAQCVRNSQEIDWVVRELEYKETYAKDALRAAEQAVELKSSGCYLSTINESEKVGKRATDKYASSAAIDEIRKSAEFVALEDARKDYLFAKATAQRWAGLQKQMNFVFEALKTTGIHYMAEAKITATIRQ